MTAASLFDTRDDGGAIFSEDRRFRFRLWRSWSTTKAMEFVHFCMLNPSIADEHALDPTLRRCIGFAQRWGFDGMIVTNLYPLVSTDPKALIGSPDAKGPFGGASNLSHIIKAAKDSHYTIVGWGATPWDMEHVRRVYEALKIKPVYCIAKTKEGHPSHPLYLAYRSDDSPGVTAARGLIEWEPPL